MQMTYNRDCDDLLRGVKTEEDFVQEAEEVIDSTTDIEEIPPKKCKVDAPAQTTNYTLSRKKIFSSSG